MPSHKRTIFMNRIMVFIACHCWGKTQNPVITVYFLTARLFAVTPVFLSNKCCSSLHLFKAHDQNTVALCDVRIKMCAGA